MKENEIYSKVKKRTYRVKNLTALKSPWIAASEFATPVTTLVVLTHSTKTLYFNFSEQSLLLVALLIGELHGSAHARILTGLCTLSGTGPGFSLFMNQS